MVVFSPVIPHQAAGMRTEPPVSVPRAQGTIRAATATAEPLLSGICSEEAEWLWADAAHTHTHGQLGKGAWRQIWKRCRRSHRCRRTHLKGTSSRVTIQSFRALC